MSPWRKFLRLSRSRVAGSAPRTRISRRNSLVRSPFLSYLYIGSQVLRLSFCALLIVLLDRRDAAQVLFQDRPEERQRSRPQGISIAIVSLILISKSTDPVSPSCASWSTSLRRKFRTSSLRSSIARFVLESHLSLLLQASDLILIGSIRDFAERGHRCGSASRAISANHQDLQRRAEDPQRDCGLQALALSMLLFIVRLSGLLSRPYLVRNHAYLIPSRSWTMLSPFRISASSVVAVELQRRVHFPSEHPRT